jgi:lambda family phage minor tail protein L
MTTNAKIKSDVQKLNVGSALVELYTIDATNIGGGTYFFTPMTSGGGRVVFNGVEYAPLPVETEGFEWEGTGKMPRPLIRVSNVNLTFVAAITNFYDLVGAKFTRRKTYAKYLDYGTEPDSSAIFPQDIFEIERKTRQNKQLIEWELKSAVDVESTMIPRGQAIDICTHTYRVYDSDTNDFDFSNASCPYTDTPSFDGEGNSTSKANDNCARKLSDCQLRYPLLTDQLPFYGFPGVGSIGYPYR